jgi:predicted hydrocarbon binding protein
MAENYSVRLLSISKVLKVESKEVLYKAGEKLASENFQQTKASDLKEALSVITEYCKHRELGNLVIDGASRGILLIRIYDCTTCVAAKNDGQTHCWIDAGFIAGALKKMLQTDYVVIETKCRGTGSEYCEFMIARKRFTG